MDSQQACRSRCEPNEVEVRRPRQPRPRARFLQDGPDPLRLRPFQLTPRAAHVGPQLPEEEEAPAGLLLVQRAFTPVSATSPGD